MMDNSISNYGVDETPVNSTAQEPAEQRMNCELEKERDDSKISMAMASGEVKDTAMSFTPDEGCVSENKQPVVQSEEKEAKEIDDNTASSDSDQNPTANDTSKKQTEEEVGVQDTVSQDNILLARYKELTEKFQDERKGRLRLRERYRKLAEENRELKKDRQLPVDHSAAFGLDPEIDQVEIEEDFETKYYDLEKKFKELLLKYDNIGKVNIKLQTMCHELEKERDELKKTIDNEDGARIQLKNIGETNIKLQKRCQELEKERDELKKIIDNEDGARDGELEPQETDKRQRWLQETFPSVYQSNSRPDFRMQTSSRCSSSCARNSSYCVFAIKDLHFCPAKLNTTMDRVLHHTPNPQNFNLKNCSNFVIKLWLLGMAQTVLEEKTGLTHEELDTTLQNGLNSLIGKHKDYVGLLTVGYSNSDDRHSVVMMNVRDPTDERIKMLIYDPQKDDWWLNADQNVEFVDKIAVIRLNAEEAKKWIPSCGQQNCDRECSQL